MLKIAITGHRRLHDRAAVRKEIAQIFSYFRQQDTDIQDISALAIGADTLFAEQALKAAIPLRVVLPFALDEYEKDFEQPADKATLRQLMGQAQSPPTVVSTLHTHTPTERNEAYLRCGQYLVDACDALIAVWDGQPARGTGGTAEIVAYAEQQGKEIHFVLGLQDGNTPEAAAERAFRDFDTRAIRYKDYRFRLAWIAGLILGVSAVIFFATGIAFRHTPLEPDEDALFRLAVLEAAGIFCSVVLLSLARCWKESFLKLRRDAEFLRTIIRYKNAGIPISPLQPVKYEPSQRVLAIEANIISEITSIRSLAHAKRLAWQLAEDQIKYHQTKRIDYFEQQEARADNWFFGLKLVFFTAVAVKFGIEVAERYHVHLPWHIAEFLPWLNFLVIVLPPAYAAVEGVKYFGDWKRNISISNEIVAQLEAIKANFLSCQDEPALLTQTAQLRQILDIENSAWAVEYGQKEVESKP